MTAKHTAAVTRQRPVNSNRGMLFSARSAPVTAHLSSIYSNRGTVCSVRSVAKCYKQDSWSSRKVTLTLTPYHKDCCEALSTFVRIYSLIQSGRLNTDIKLTLYNALIRSVLLPPLGSMRRTLTCRNWNACRTEYFAQLEMLTGAHQSAN
jgi:hypothetical protein